MFLKSKIKQLSLAIVLLLSFVNQTKAAIPEKSSILSDIKGYHYESLKQYGESVIPALLELYKEGDNPQKTLVAGALYYLSIKSEEAREILMKDIHTPDQDLRLQVQWAVGRVSNDDIVVRALLDNMRNDPNPVFRDKAACALAHDQPHLTEKQRVLLLEGLVQALEDEKPDVRNIASLALQIQTGQNTTITGSNPLIMTGNTAVINGTYTPSSPTDTDPARVCDWSCAIRAHTFAKISRPYFAISLALARTSSSVPV